MKLNERNLEALGKQGISVPAYDRRHLKRAIVHIGLGHFHRAHFLTYLDTLIRQGDTDWGVFETDIIPSGVLREKLERQDFLYSLLTLAPDGTRELRVNGPVLGYSADPEEVLSVLSSPETKLITLTITEKGYAYDDRTGSLDFSHPGIIHDLKGEGLPVTAAGFLALSLKNRFLTQSPVTIMSCDNVPENGVMLRRTVLEMARHLYPEIVPWIEECIAFPSTMVDRITPGTTAEDLTALSERYGLEDELGVRSESFLQWVIEDKTATPIPDFSKAGALVVPDVKPYELMKIRLLNGSHSALSYPAYMLGIKLVHEAAVEPSVHAFIRDRYMEELSQTLPPVPGMDLAGYKDELIRRFSNPYIADTILRLCSDGSKKIANAMLRPLEEALDKKLGVEAISDALALWEFFYLYKDQDGNPMPLDDPAAQELLAVADSPRDFLRIAGLASQDESFFRGMEERLLILKEKGVREFLQRMDA